MYNVLHDVQCSSIYKNITKDHWFNLLKACNWANSRFVITNEEMSNILTTPHHVRHYEDQLKILKTEHE